MRLLYVIDSLAVGGAERSLVELAPHLRRGGTDVHVVTLRTAVPNLSAEARAAGVELHPSAEGLTRRQAIRAVRRLITDLNPDHVHTTLAESDIVGRIAAATAHVTVSSSLVNVSYGKEHYASVPHRHKLAAFQAIDATTARLTTRLHAVSSAVKTALSRRLGYPERRIDVVPRGRNFGNTSIQTDERMRAVRQSLGGSLDEVWLLAISSHEHRKALDVLLRAVGQVATSHPAIRLTVLGREGAHTEALREYSGSLGLDGRVVWLEPVADVRPYILASDIFALPSRREGFPGALIEAMALGVRCVLSDIPPTREIVGPNPPPGIELVPTDDPASLALAIEHTLRSPRPPRALAESTVEQYDLAHVSAQMQRFFTRASGG